MIEKVEDEEIIEAIDELIKSAWIWGECCSVDDVAWEETGDSYNETWRDNVNRIKEKLISLIYGV